VESSRSSPSRANDLARFVTFALVVSGSPPDQACVQSLPRPGSSRVGSDVPRGELDERSGDSRVRARALEKWEGSLVPAQKGRSSDKRRDRGVRELWSNDLRWQVSARSVFRIRRYRTSSREFARYRFVQTSDHSCIAICRIGSTCSRSRRRSTTTSSPALPRTQSFVCSLSLFLPVPAFHNVSLTVSYSIRPLVVVVLKTSERNPPSRK
jgi:hypothetical protein